MAVSADVGMVGVVIMSYVCGCGCIVLTERRRFRLHAVVLPSTPIIVQCTVPNRVLLMMFLWWRKKEGLVTSWWRLLMRDRRFVHSSVTCWLVCTNPTFTCTQGLFQMLVILLPEIIPCLFSLKLANITKLSGWCWPQAVGSF